MACSINVLKIKGIGTAPIAGAAPAAIIVHGTWAECEPGIDGDHIEVVLSCGDPQTTDPLQVVGTRSAEVFPDGTFHAVFADIGKRCPCGSRVEAVATCATNAACPPGTLTDILECGLCPVFHDSGDDVGGTDLQVECEPDGTATVTITRDVENTTPDPIVVVVDCGADQVGPTGPNSLPLAPGQSGQIVGVCRYPSPGTPADARILTLDSNLEPTGCPPLVVEIPNVDKCSPDCANLEEIIIEIADRCVIDPADNTEKRAVTFTPVISGPAPTVHTWNFGDGSTPVLQFGPPAVTTHPYEIRPLIAPQLCIIGPGCSQQCVSVPLSEFDAFIPCGCPSELDVQIAIRDCETDPSDNIAKRQVRFTPTVSGSNPTTHSWNFGDGTPPLSDGGAPVVTDHLYAAAPTSAPSLHLVGPAGCPNQTFAVDLAEFAGFAPCDGGPPPRGEEPPESLACHGLALLAALFFAIALLLGLFAACFTALAPEFGIAAAVAAAIGAILAALYAWRCPSGACRWLLRMTAHTLIGAGMLAFMFSKCCPWLFFLGGIGLLLAGIALMIKWASDCNISKCDFLVELTLASGIVLPANGIFSAVNKLLTPDLLAPVAACQSTAGVSIVAGIVVPSLVAVLVCKYGAGDAPDNSVATDG